MLPGRDDALPGSHRQALSQRLGLVLQARYTAGCCGIAADIACNTAVPADKAALAGTIATSFTRVAAGWLLAEVTAVGPRGTTGKSERATVA